ncbi:MAG: GGDEF domain-containing protein [Pseudomonadota bacterium]|nr:GGDEF domain-containing protein [Pseudomonadota bacterium]
MANPKQKDRFRLAPPFVWVSWAEQRRQYWVRFFFATILLLYFLTSASFPPVLFGRQGLLGLIAVYFMGTAAFMLHARWQPESMRRAQAAMWFDYIVFALVIAHDPSPVIPTMLVLLTVLLSNGLRYGESLMESGLAGAILAIPLILALRGWGGGIVPEMGTFLMFFLYAVLALYAAMLMWQVQRLRRRFRHVSFRDEATGMLERRAVFEAAEVMFNLHARSGRPAVLLLVDIPGLPQISDSAGRAMANRLLREFARLLRMNLRNYDVAGRYRWNQFVLLLPDTDARHASQVASRIRESATRRLADFLGRPVTVNMVMAQAPLDATDFGALLEKSLRAIDALSRLDVPVKGVPLISEVEDLVRVRSNPNPAYE